MNDIQRVKRAYKKTNTIQLHKNLDKKKQSAEKYLKFYYIYSEKYNKKNIKIICPKY